MVSPDLQILLHGESISNAEVSLMNESGVDLVNVVRFANSNYLLLYLDLSRAIPQIFDIVLKNDDFESIIPYQLRERENNALTTFDSSDVVYLLMPDRFSRREVSKMSTPKMLEKTVCSNRPDARNGGNILGMQDRLGYLADLGVTAIWHTPLLENDMPEYSYHGYAIWNCYACKRVAIIERTVSYRGYAIGNCYTCKLRAIIERTVSYRGYTIGNRYTCKRGAIAERIVSYRGYAIRDCYACKRFAIRERIFSYRGYAIRGCYACKRFAIRERIFSYRGYAIWNSYAFKRSAIIERRLSYLIYGLAVDYGRDFHRCACAYIAFNRYLTVRNGILKLACLFYAFFIAPYNRTV
jgi:hypothetical protein